MRILIMTLGTRGDVQPYVALGKGLQAEGHAVTICASECFESFVTEHGLGYAYLNNDLSEVIESDVGHDFVENAQGVFGLMRAAWRMKRRLPDMNRRMIADTWAAAEATQPDLILYHPKTFAAPDFAEVLNIPAILTLLQPVYVSTGTEPFFAFPRVPLGSFYNRLTYQFVLTMSNRVTRRWVREWRAAHGLPPRRYGVLETPSGRSRHVLHGFSQHVNPRPSDWPETAHVCGYWFLEEPAWQMPATLEAFLAGGEPPVYVGFGSMAGRRPRELASIVLKALDLAGLRGVLASGWGGLAADDVPDSIHLLKHAPHDQLFPHMAAVVHHGGAGTTAAGLRAGRPSVICPFIVDQPYWGRRVHALGAGPMPVHQKRLTPEALAAALQEATNNTTIQACAARIGESLRAEEGIANTVRLLGRL